MPEPIEYPLRITLVGPPKDVMFGLQRGKSELVQAKVAKGKDLSFDLTVRLAPGKGHPRLLGPFCQGPPTARFVYVNSGTSAGQLGSVWTRRAKIPLVGITRALIEEAPAGLGARISGVAKDGGPVCASIPLLEPGWQPL